MTVQINWPTNTTELHLGTDHSILASVLSDMSLKDMTLTGNLTWNDESAHTTTGEFIEVVRVDGQDIWLFNVPLPLPLRGSATCCLSAAWTDAQGEYGNAETSFPIHTVDGLADMSGITWPRTGDPIPRTNFIPYGRLDALLLSSGPAPCIHGYPCLLNASGIRTDPTSGPFQDPIALHTWRAIYATVAAGTYSLQVKDVNNVGQTSTGLTA